MPDPILVICGTNRPSSNTALISKLILDCYADAGVSADLYSLADLPPEVFHPDVYGVKPDSFKPVQERVVRSLGLHVVLPEYNGSFPGILKYFVDLLKFPESFAGKPVAFVGLGAGEFGGLRPVEQMQMVFAYRNAYLFPDRVFVTNVRSRIGPDGRLNDRPLHNRLAKQAAGFAAFAGVVKGNEGGSVGTGEGAIKSRPT